MKERIRQVNSQDNTESDNDMPDIDDEMPVVPQRGALGPPPNGA